MRLLPVAALRSRSRLPFGYTRLYTRYPITDSVDLRYVAAPDLQLLYRFTALIYKPLIYVDSRYVTPSIPLLLNSRRLPDLALNLLNLRLPHLFERCGCCLTLLFGARYLCYIANWLLPVDVVRPVITLPFCCCSLDLLPRVPGDLLLLR